MNRPEDVKSAAFQSAGALQNSGFIRRVGLTGNFCDGCHGRLPPRAFVL